jgi:hypothetical protein
MARRKDPYKLGASWTQFYRPVKGNDPYQNAFSIIPYGPRGLHLRDEVISESSPWAFVRAHPELFSTPSTTFDEGVFYWALLQLRGPEGPEGGWQYQTGVRPGGQKVGGATVDFVIDVYDGKPIACRIVTPYHEGGFVFAGPEKEASDELQIFTLEEQGYEVIDAYSKLWMSDQTGLAALHVAQRVLDKDPSFNPNSFTFIGNF